MKVLNPSRKFSRILPILLLTLVLASCSKTVRFNISPVIPAAVGTVKLGTDDNKNRTVTLSIKNLVDPGRLTPPKKIYVVWMQTKSNGVKSLGTLISTEGYFSSTRTASFTSVIRDEPMRFYITAEDNASVTGPGPVTVLTTSDF